MVKAIFAFSISRLGTRSHVPGNGRVQSVRHCHQTKCVAQRLQCHIRIENTDEYREWIDGHKALVGRARIYMRVYRPIHGYPAGSHRNLTHGVAEPALDAGLGYRVNYGRESLYRALSEGGNPSFATVLKVARALGVRLHAQPS